jgi:hypothetical protein
MSTDFCGKILSAANWKEGPEIDIDIVHIILLQRRGSGSESVKDSEFWKILSFKDLVSKVTSSKIFKL